MQRIHAPFDEPTLEQIGQEVEKSGVSGLNAHNRGMKCSRA